MLIAVIKSCDRGAGRKLSVKQLGKILTLEAGEKVSKRRLLRTVSRFGGKYIATSELGLKKCGTVDFGFAQNVLLFSQFAGYLLEISGKELSVGIVDPQLQCLDLSLLTKTVAHCSEVTVCTEKDCDALFLKLLFDTGICPEAVASPQHLMHCDCVFAPNGLQGFKGVLFGKGGLQIDPDKLIIPPPYRELLARGIDPIDLWSALFSEGVIHAVEAGKEDRLLK